MRTGFAGAAVLVCVLAGVSACADRNDDGGVAVAGICTSFTTAPAVSADPTAVQPVPGGGGDARDELRDDNRATGDNGGAADKSTFDRAVPANVGGRVLAESGWEPCEFAV